MWEGAKVFAIIFSQFAARKIFNKNYFYLYSSWNCILQSRKWVSIKKPISSYCNTDMLSAMARVWPVILAETQTCHTCLIWHQGLYTISSIFDLSQDIFIVLCANFFFHSRFWWNTPKVHHKIVWRTKMLVTDFLPQKLKNYLSKQRQAGHSSQ